MSDNPEKEKKPKKNYITEEQLMSTLVNFESVITQKFVESLMRVRQQVEYNRVANVRTVLDALIEEHKK